MLKILKIFENFENYDLKEGLFNPHLVSYKNWYPYIAFDVLPENR